MEYKRVIGQRIDCLDHGFVRMVDYMGDDDAIVQAARVSYGDGTKTIREDKGLINYLLKNEHTTPFEMVEFKFHCSMPIFVARQWIRHRTANVNEYSARYSILKDEFHIPETFRAQAKGRGAKQIAEGHIDPAVESALLSEYDGLYRTAYRLYQKALTTGVGRELARICIPVAVSTEWYWKIDLHNLFRFLKLRLRPTRPVGDPGLRRSHGDHGQTDRTRRLRRLRRTHSVRHQAISIRSRTDQGLVEKTGGG